MLSKEQREQIKKEVATWPEHVLRSNAQWIFNPCINDLKKREEIDLWVDAFIEKYKKEKEN